MRCCSCRYLRSVRRLWASIVLADDFASPDEKDTTPVPSSGPSSGDRMVWHQRCGTNRHQTNRVGTGFFVDCSLEFLEQSSGIKWVVATESLPVYMRVSRGEDPAGWKTELVNATRRVSRKYREEGNGRPPLYIFRVYEMKPLKQEWRCRTIEPARDKKKKPSVQKLSIDILVSTDSSKLLHIAETWLQICSQK